VELTSEKLAATAVLHAEIQIILRLEGVVKGDNERVVAGSQNFLLSQCAFDFVALDHLLLAQN
jgi:hypothetical protein